MANTLTLILEAIASPIDAWQVANIKRSLPSLFPSVANPKPYAHRFEPNQTVVLRHGERYGDFPDLPFAPEAQTVGTDTTVTIVTYGFVNSKEMTWLAIDDAKSPRGHKGIIYVVRLVAGREVTVFEESLSDHTLR
jgi:hypothetical protein